jgi:hypothetical protein
MTVLNGHFTMHSGDEVQWYFDFESDLFQHGGNPSIANGFRLDNKKGPGLKATEGPQRKKRSDFFDQRLYGTGGGYGKSMGVKETRSVVRIKSYHMHKNDRVCFDHYVDKSRVFAKCISSCRPFDMVDIMLMTQSS